LVAAAWSARLASAGLLREQPWAAFPPASTLKGHGFSYTPMATISVAVPVDGKWRVLGPDGERHTRRLHPPKSFTLARCDRAVLRLYSDYIWGCGRRNPDTRKWAKRVAAGKILECGGEVPQNQSVKTIQGTALLGLDPFSPVFQHAMVNGVAALASVWHLFTNETDTKLLCAEWTCDVSRIALYEASLLQNGAHRRLLYPKKPPVDLPQEADRDRSRVLVADACTTYYFPNGLITAHAPNQIPPRGTYDVLQPGLTAHLLSEKTPPGFANVLRAKTFAAAAAAGSDLAFDVARAAALLPDRSLLYATRRAQTFHGVRQVRNETVVIDALRNFSEQRGLRFQVFQHTTAAEDAKAWSNAAVVVAPHGGALANLVHLPPGASVVEIMPRQSSKLFYAGMCYALRHRYFAYAAKVFPGYNTAQCGRCEIQVDARDLVQFLETHVFKGGPPSRERRR